MFGLYNGKIQIENGPGLYKVTEDPLWLLSVLPLNKSSYLEVGCATGIMSLILRLKNDKAVIKAIDIQYDMIELAKHYAKENNIEDINFTQQDLFKLDDNEQFDCVFSNPPYKDLCKCCHLNDCVKDKAHVQEDIAAFISKMVSHVKSNGVLCFIGHVSTKEEIRKSLVGKYNLKEIAIISSPKKSAKRYIYILDKSKSEDFEQLTLNAFDDEIRKQILFFNNSVEPKILEKRNFKLSK